MIVGNIFFQSVKSINQNGIFIEKFLLEQKGLKLRARNFSLKEESTAAAEETTLPKELLFKELHEIFFFFCSTFPRHMKVLLNVLPSHTANLSL